MDGTLDLDIGCQEITVKNKRVKKTRSKIFKKLLEILHSGKERHVIQFTNDQGTEFEIKLIDKKNKQWTEKDISLFLALDSVSCKPREQKHLAESTKNRFKSNITKWLRGGYLEYLGSRPVSKGIVYKKYRILKDCPIWDEIEEGYSPESTDTESKEISEDISSNLESPSKCSCSFPSSHYSCLSGESSESEEYQSILYGNAEIINNLLVAKEEIVGVKEYIAGEVQQNTSIVNQYVEKTNCNSEEYQSILYGDAESINNLLVAREKIVGVQEYIAGEVQQSTSIVNQYVEEKTNCNSEEYQSILYGDAECINNLLVAKEEIVGVQEYIAGEVQQSTSIVNQYVEEKTNCNSEEYQSILYGDAECINNLLVAKEEIVGVKEYIAGEVQNTSIVNQYVEEKTNCNSEEYQSILYGDAECINNLLVAKEEIVGVKEYIAGEVQNTSIVNQYVEKTNCNSDEHRNMLYGSEESINILPEVNENNAGEVDQNLSGVKQYVERNKRKLNLPDTESKKFRELDWSPTKNYFDDATMFEEMEGEDEILKDSTNPLLSSAVVLEERTGSILDSNWQNVYKIFSFDETMYDST